MDRLKNSGSVSDSKRDFLPVFRHGCRWSFTLSGCMVFSDRRRVSGRVPCMVSDGKKLIYKSVSSVPGSDRSEVPLHFRADSLRLGLGPGLRPQLFRHKTPYKVGVWSYSIFDELLYKRLILKYIVFYDLDVLRI